MLAVGTLLGPYRILDLVGSGGMGEVYRARDERLGRDVAIKVISGAAPPDAEQTRRFEQEARSAGALSHPNVCAVYDVGSEDGRPFVVMELLEGESLRQKLRAGALPMRKAVDYVAQAARGLAAAHAKGVVHRDLKPENLFVTRDGRVKILDFGLAKLTGRETLMGEGPAADSLSPTQTGVILGTVGYMAPEQVLGRSVDVRADLFALGAILYELLAGRRAFGRATNIETLHAILNDEPGPLAESARDVSPGLEMIVRRCLEKSPDERFQSAQDLAFALETPSAAFSGARSFGSSRSRRMPRPVLAMGFAAAVLALALALARLMATGPRATPPSWRRLTFDGDIYSAAISPDGKTIAYTRAAADGAMSVLVRDLIGGRSLEVLKRPIVYGMRWSPTGNDIVVRAGEPPQTLVVPRMGGTPRSLPGGGIFALSPDGSTLASTELTHKRLMLRSVTGQDTTVIPIESRFAFLTGLDWSPDGKRLLILTTTGPTWTLWTIRRDGSGQQMVYQDSAALVTARWAPSGAAIYFLRNRGVTADLMKLGIRGSGDSDGHPARRLLSTPEISVGPSPFEAAFSLTRDGRNLVYRRVDQLNNLWWIGRPGPTGPPATEPRPLTEGAGTISDARLSPDGRRVAYVSNQSGAQNLHVLSLTDSSGIQLTFTERGVGSSVAWSPDGSQIAYTANDGEVPRVWTVPSTGGPARLYRKTLPSADVLDWAPGPAILYEFRHNQNFCILDPESEQERPLVANDSVGWMFNPRWSPDGRHVALDWNRSRRGLWVVSTMDTSQTLLESAGEWGGRLLIGWDARGTALHLRARRGAGSGLRRISYPGGVLTEVETRPVGRLDVLDCAPDLRVLMGTRSESRSDVWMLENFDPATR